MAYLYSHEATFGLFVFIDSHRRSQNLRSAVRRRYKSLVDYHVGNDNAVFFLVEPLTIAQIGSKRKRNVGIDRLYVT